MSMETIDCGPSKEVLHKRIRERDALIERQRARIGALERVLRKVLDTFMNADRDQYRARREAREVLDEGDA